MAEIARWTTPSVTYKPSMVEMEEVDKIFLVVQQGGANLIVKDKSEAEETEDGFVWTLTQTESATLLSRRSAIIQVDYTDIAGSRYTTHPKQFEIGDSGINEVI